ncbi:MAG: molybdopterin-dependent oxidoreductase [Dehalococcoidia bacterium]|nr:molybdopterin-dependent oxidoreductase [Dehalococcoidia bacterium]
MTATATAAPALRRLKPADAGTHLAEILARPYEYRGWEDVYRDEWTWDKVTKVTHTRVNCISACSIDAYVKDGIVWREEQNATYEQSFEDVPDFNPRGCTSGCVYSVQMYDPTRIKYPMKRVGERGSGKWQRLSWDQALTEIADKLIDTATHKDGPECIIYDNGTTNLDFGIGSPMEGHLFTAGLGSTSIDSYAGVGDLPVGLIQAWGLYMSEGTADDWFLTDYALIWIGNPSYTRVPEAHFLYEARYRGAKIVTVSPDFSASTVHADRWLNPRYATDAALALGMLNVIINEKLYKTDYIKEQTDLPFLVRTDTQQFLRQSDLEEDGSENIFYFWNANTGRRAEAPGTWGSSVGTIRLDDDVDPELEGTHTVKLKDGKRVKVRTVFDLMKDRVNEYPLDRVAEITGVHPGNIARVAREFAAAKSAMIYASWGACKHYHSDLFQRGMAYLCALTGNSGGKPGSGIKVSTWWPPPATVLMGGGIGGGGLRLQTEPAGELPIDRVSMQEFSKMTFQMGRMGNASPLIPWLYAHDKKWREIAHKQSYNDPSLPRPVKQYLKEALAENWQPVSPKPPRKPKFLYFSGPNPLRRWPNPKLIRDSLWAGLETIVTCDFRMSTSGLYSDYILPACGYYEKPGIKYTSSYVPYVIVGDRAVPPLYDSMHEWDITLLLAKKIQERSRERGIEPYTDSRGGNHNLATLFDDLSADGHYLMGEEGEEKALDYIMQYSAITRNSGLGEGAWGKAAERGMVKIKKVQPSALAVYFNAVYSDYTEEEPMNQCGWFVNMKNPWPTLTGRQQFYIDHPWFLEAGEEMLVHKEPVQSGGKYPIRMTGGHTRWSMHSIWRANPQLLRLQRGEPVAYISAEDAARRKIKDHDYIRLKNDVGKVELRAKVSPSVQPGSAIVYHAWEGYQFRDWATQNDVTASPIKPTNMVGNYGQLHYRMASYTMNHVPKEVAIEIEKVEDRR